MKMIPITETDGSPDLTPCDFHGLHATTIPEWMLRAEKEGHPPDMLAAEMVKRAGMYRQAYAWYLEAAIQAYGEHGDELREHPWVYEVYDPIADDVVATWFLFKADNNGNTYKVKFVND